MAIERMSIAKISAGLDSLDTVLDEICSAGVFEPEQAHSFYSADMDLVPFESDNTSSQKLSDLENLAKNAGITLHLKDKSDITALSKHQEYHFSFLSEKLKTYSEEKKSLVEQMKDPLSNAQALTKQLEELDTEMKELCKNKEEQLSLVFSKLSYDCAKNDIKSLAYHNGEYFFLAGWVPEKHSAEFEKTLKKLGNDITIEISKPDETLKVKPPVNVTGFAKILKYIVEPYTFYIDMYSTPSYNDLDITAFVAITYTILFGMMFGDMGQGLVISIAGALMWKLKGMALGRILIPCGISSMIFGFIFGSVFGYEHMLDPVYKALGWKGKPIEVFENVNLVLLLAISMGVTLVMCAIILNIIRCIKRKCFGEALLSQNGVVGLVLYLCGANLASEFMGGFSPVDASVCAVIIGISAVILIIKEPFIELIDHHHFHKPESILDFFLQNIFELVEYILAYMSNTVSFLRVGAFVLVHAGMMMVVFSLAGESENIFVIILGNILVIALEGLLTGIQALRLEYYEMFSRFYIGDGRKFNPVKPKNNN